MTPNNFVRRQLLDNATNWEFPNATAIQQSGTVLLTYREGNFSVSFNLQPAVRGGSHAAANPHMVRTANSTVLDIAIANFTYTTLPPRDKASNSTHRLALEAFFYHLDSQVGAESGGGGCGVVGLCCFSQHRPLNPSQTVTTHETQSIDDEYAPSIFRRRDFLVPATPAGATPQRTPSYFSFKPVAFGSLGRCVWFAVRLIFLPSNG